MEKRKKYMALKWKLTFAIVPIVGLIALLVFLFTYMAMRNAVVNQVMEAQNIVGYVSSERVMRTLNAMWYFPLMGTAGMLILTSLICVGLIGRQMRGLEKTKENIIAIMNGDFTVQVPVHTGRWENEITQINSNLGSFIVKMDRLLREIGITTQKLSEHSEHFSSMAEELNLDAVSQNEALDNLTTTMEDMAQCIQTLAGNATDLAQIAQKTRESGSVTNRQIKNMLEASLKTGEDINAANSSMQRLEVSMEELTQLVTSVSEAASRINTITEVIKGIADQTNLLSLNASIEAARAGESGKGFAVVATEIKSLADTSGQNATAIEQLIENISALIERTAESTKKSRDGIKEGSELLNQTAAAFGKIMDVASDTGKVLDELEEDIGRVNRISEDMAAITQEQAASSQEILATTVHVNALVAKTKEKSDDIRKGTEALHIASADLNHEMQYFEI